MRWFRILTYVNAVCVTVSMIGYYALSDLAVPYSSAASTIYCLKICSAGSPSCDSGSCTLLPSVTTDSIDAITQYSATGHGTVVSDNGHSITQRGFVIATTTDPTVADTTYTVSGGVGSFSQIFSGLHGNTGYYTRAFAVNEGGTNYGASMYFTTLASTTSSLPGTSATSTSSVVAGGGTSPAPLQFVSPEEIANALLSTEPPDAQPRVTSDYFGPIQEEADIQAAGVTTKIFTNKVVMASGTTNIRDAYIFLIINDESTVHLTHAKADGSWQFVFPRVFIEGEYELYVRAMSPTIASIFAEDWQSSMLRHETVPEQPTIPPATVTPSSTPPIIGTQDRFDITRPKYSIEIVPIVPEGGLKPTGTLDVETHIKNISSLKLLNAELTYKVYDAHGEVIFSQRKNASVTTDQSRQDRLQIGRMLAPGTYIITVEMNVADMPGTIIASSPVRIYPMMIIQTPLLSVSTEQAADVLLRAGVLFGSLLALFGVLLYREMRAMRYMMKQVSDHDLYYSGMVG